MAEKCVYNLIRPQDSSYIATYAQVHLSIKYVPAQIYDYDCNSTLIQKDSLYKVECRQRPNPHGEKSLFSIT